MEANLTKATLTGANLKDAILRDTDLEGAILLRANLVNAHPETAHSLKDTWMNAVTGLTQKQRDQCARKGAIFDGS